MSLDRLGTLAQKDPQGTGGRGAQGGPVGNRVLPETAEMTGFKAVLALKEERLIDIFIFTRPFY